MPSGLQNRYASEKARVGSIPTCTRHDPLTYAPAGISRRGVSVFMEPLILISDKTVVN